MGRARKPCDEPKITMVCDGEGIPRAEYDALITRLLAPLLRSTDEGKRAFENEATASTDWSI